MNRFWFDLSVLIKTIIGLFPASKTFILEQLHNFNNESFVNFLRLFPYPIDNHLFGVINDNVPLFLNDLIPFS